MKIVAALAFCLLCIHFKTLHGVSNCSSLPACVKGNLSADLLSHAQQIDEFPKENFTFHCPVHSQVKGFHIKLWKGQREVCTFYKDNGKTSHKCDEFCDVVAHNDRVSFILKNLKSKHSDTYTCCLEIVSPISAQCKAGEKHLYIEVCCFRNAVCQHIQSSHDYNNEYMSMAAVKPS
ncbi:inducible T-cell costimulator [Anolis sagrei]|uniref:inducible T-cell costimulator n=1 Tax=Anolis sagrei TaxID=38937 RepID=UPI00351FC365